MADRQQLNSAFDGDWVTYLMFAGIVGESRVCGKVINNKYEAVSMLKCFRKDGRMNKFAIMWAV